MMTVTNDHNILQDAHLLQALLSALRSQFSHEAHEKASIDAMLLAAILQYAALSVPRLLHAKQSPAQPVSYDNLKVSLA